jgi:hypothetical protein
MTWTESNSLQSPLFEVYPTYERALDVLIRMTNAGMAQRDVDIVEALPLDPRGFSELAHRRLANAIESGSVVLVIRPQDEKQRAMAQTAIIETLPDSDDACTVAAEL